MNITDLLKEYLVDFDAIIEWAEVKGHKHLSEKIKEMKAKAEEALCSCK
jgi:hypothetical protein